MHGRDTVAVIVGRFQVPELHRGHRDLLAYAIARHDRVFVVIGSTGGLFDLHDFLPYDMRKEMILEVFPSVTVAELKDHPISFKAWSEELDALVATTFPGRRAVGYGGNSSFIRQYSGNMSTVIVPDVNVAGGTEIRRSVAIPNTYEVRLGMLNAQRLRPPVVYPTGDLAIISPDLERVILINRRRECGLFRFPGGFSEKKDRTFKDTAVREGAVEEILGVTIHHPQHIESASINDHRYRSSEDCIKTTFFAAVWKSGEPKAGDDADGAGWFRVQDLENVLVPAHQPLGLLLKGYVRSMIVA